MREVVKMMLSPSKKYKVEIIKRADGFYTVEGFKWFESEHAYPYEYWSPIKQGLSLIDSEERAIRIGLEQLKVQSGEEIGL